MQISGKSGFQRHNMGYPSHNYPSNFLQTYFSFVIWKWFQLLNLFDEIRFLVVKLPVLGPVRVELGEEVHQLVLVSDQNVKDWLWFVWVCDKHLEHVERLELDVPRLLLQHVHHELKVVWAGDVSGHHREVVSVQKKLTQQLQGLSSRHVVVRVQ